jgi:hypothetical protein
MMDTQQLGSRNMSIFILLKCILWLLAHAALVFQPFEVLFNED